MEQSSAVMHLKLTKNELIFVGNNKYSLLEYPSLKYELLESVSNTRKSPNAVMILCTFLRGCSSDLVFVRRRNSRVSLSSTAAPSDLHTEFQFSNLTNGLSYFAPTVSYHHAINDETCARALGEIPVDHPT